jgi:predicted alpha-1,2-mannosidase
MARRLLRTLLAVALTLQVAPSAARAGAPRVQEVDPFIGTAGEGNTFPGAAAPFGMLQWSPDTTTGPGGYRFEEHVIQGFSLTHLSGAGCPAYQDALILPTARPILQSPGSHWAAYNADFSHANESAAPGRYGVRLDPDGVQADLTVTRRAGLARFRFPPGAAASVLVNASASVLPVADSAIEVVGDSLVFGHVSAGGFCASEHRYRLYFAAEFERPFSAFGTWADDQLAPGERAVELPGGSEVGAYVTFDTRRESTVLLKVGISFVSPANALANLKTIDGWDFGRIQAATTADWEERLGRIEVEGGTAAQRTTFYTALYHAFLHPNLFSDANGEYLGFDEQIHLAQGYEQYANFSGWDIYRSQVPLLAWLAPAETSDMLRSLVEDARAGGALPRWPLANDDTGIMVGDPSPLIIAAAHAFGADRLDLPAAFQAMQWGADWSGARARAHEVRPGQRDYLDRGYVPLESGGLSGSAAATLEYGSADFAVAQIAEAVGQRAAAEQYMQRAQRAWQQLMNSRTGFIHPRTPSGAFLLGFDPDAGTPSPFGEQVGFVEGDTWQYTWMVPFNARGLIAALGGRQETVRRLDAFFAELNAGPVRPHAWMGNQPSFGAPWLYAFAGAPSRTQAVVRRIVSELFSATPLGLPGNDDLGSTSAWYVWAALGLYPAIPGVGGFVLASPLFPSVTVKTGRGQRLRVQASGPDPYVRGLQLNGKPYARSWLPLEALAGEAPSLSFTLEAQPDPRWGSDPDAAPPSFTQGQLPAIGFSSVDAVSLAPGGYTEVTLGVRNVTAEARRVQWTAIAPEGLHVDPDHGTIELDGSAAATVPISLTAPAHDGCAVLVLPVSTVPDGTALPSPVIPVTVGDGPACD